MLEEDVGHLPVVSGRKLVGMCTRTDVLRARRVRMESERLQPGWVHLGENGRRRWWSFSRSRRGADRR